jgi:hypothetical protein
MPGMGVDAIIRRKDKKPMGSPDEVQKRLSESFSGAEFSISFSGRWNGHFQRNGLAIEFYFNSAGPISDVRISMYGKIDQMYEYVKNWSDWNIDVY